MICFKLGVPFATLQWPMIQAIMLLGRVWEERFAVNLVITATTDGTHMQGSLHYEGLAIDIRTSNLPQGSGGVVMAVKAITDTLGFDSGFQVVPETDHIHLEYDRIYKKPLDTPAT